MPIDQSMNTLSQPFLSTLTRQPLKLKMSRWLLVLVVFWQALLMLMPVAQAKAAAGDGSWETICTMQGSSKVWKSMSQTPRPNRAATARCV